jgi:hypothetical protein
MSAWILVIMLKIGSAGSAVAMDMPSQAACTAALEEAKKADSYADGFCLPRR